MVLVADGVLISVALIATIIAGWNDLKTREVPDWISYGLIITAFTIRLMESLLSGVWSYFYYAIFGFLAMYVFGMIMFRTRQWGGGDAKLIMGLGVIFATRPYFVPESHMPFLIILVINILLVGAVYGIIFGIWLAWKNRVKFKKVISKLLRQKAILQLRIITLFVAIPLFIISFFFQTMMLRLSSMIVALLLLIYPYLWTFIKAVENACLLKQLSPSKLTEGDWVEGNVVVKNKVIYKPKNIGIESADIKKLIKAKVKSVLVKDGIPFTPTFLLGILLSLWNGGIILLL